MRTYLTGLTVSLRVWQRCHAQERGPKGPRGAGASGGAKVADGLPAHADDTAAAESDWAIEVMAIKEQVLWLLTSDLLATNVPPIVGSRDATAVFLPPGTLPN